ncbi:MAG: lipopolysaccharide biosynthesis protein [Deltaproteobacteria bacterium]|nr:lipopolysaccharide biosynthesis protein [Deltaproteobacteria bacterium]
MCVQRLTVTIIARNEADRIGAAIQSVDFADEVLVVDSGSTDDTIDVARSLGARVIETDWPGYREQKNRAMGWATYDWVLGLDADERVNSELAAAITEVLRSPQAAGYEMSRLGHWMGAEIHHGTWRPDRAIRLFDRRFGRWTGGSVHELVEVDGPVHRVAGELVHHPYRDLEEQLQSIQRYAQLFVDDARQDGVRARWWDVVFRPFFHLFKALVLRAGIRDGIRGWCLAALGATHVMLKWGMLYLAQDEP